MKPGVAFFAAEDSQARACTPNADTARRTGVLPRAPAARAPARVLLRLLIAVGVRQATRLPRNTPLTLARCKLPNIRTLPKECSMVHWLGSAVVVVVVVVARAGSGAARVATVPAIPVSSTGSGHAPTSGSWSRLAYALSVLVGCLDFYLIVQRSKYLSPYGVSMHGCGSAR